MDYRWIPLLLPLGVPALAAPPSTPNPAAADLATAVERMARVSFSNSPALSPDGKQVAFVSNRSGVPQVWIAATDGSGEPRRVGSFDDPVTGVDWSPDGRWLALAVAPGGGLNEQIHLVHPDGSGLKRITDGGQENNRLAGWSGRLLRFSSSRKDPASLDAYVYDAETGETRFVAANPGVGTLTDISRDGKRALLHRVRSRGDSNLFLVDLATGKEELLTPHEPPGTFEDGKFAPDGRTVYLIANQDADNIYFARMRLGPNGKPQRVEKLTSRDEVEVDGFELHPAGTSAMVGFNVAGRSELALLDLQTLRLSPVPNLPGEIVGGLDYAEDGQRLALVLGGAKLPNEIWILQGMNGPPRQVTFSPHEGVDLATLVAPELVRFPAHDGLELSGWLYRPPGGGPGPVVISFHGGPEGQERPSFKPDYQALLSRGIGVFAPNVRGSSGFGKRFVNLDNGPLRIESLKDIKACVDFLVGGGIADPKRIGIMGGSYGGYMTLAGLTEYPDLFAAGANLFGIVNFETFFAHTQPWMAAVSTKEYGDPVTQKDLLRQLSPLYKLDRVRAPLLVLHGANDTNVPLVEAQQVADELKKRGVPVESVIFPDEGHGFRKIPNRVRSTVEIVRWFERHLKPISS